MSRAAARLSRASAPVTGAQKTAGAFTASSAPSSFIISKPELQREEYSDGDDQTLDEEKSGHEDDLLQQLDQVCYSSETILENLNRLTE